MNNELTPSNVSLSDIKLRDFLYLDRARLLSYMAQVYDGLNVSRRMGSVATRGRLDSTVERTQEITEKVLGEAGAAPFGVGVKAEHEKQTTKSFTTGGDWIIGLENSSFDEIKQDHDNLFILFEDYLNKTRRLTVLEKAQELKTSFVQITGALSIEDRDFIVDIVSLIDDFASLDASNKEAMKEMTSNKKKLMAVTKIIKNLKVAGIHVQVKNQHIQVGATLNSAYLTVTFEQLRSLFIPHPVETTVLGLILPKTQIKTPQSSGIFENINFVSFFQKFAVNADYVVYPIAIYQTI